MASARTLVGAALGVAILMLFMSPITGVIGTNTGVQQVTNESVTADSGTFVELRGYDVEPNSETVLVENDTGTLVEATAGTDYEMNNSAGSIKAIEGSTLVQDGEEMLVSYNYQATDEMTALVVGFIPEMIAVLGLAVVGKAVGRAM